MPDIINEIDKAHANAARGPVRRCDASGTIESADGVFIASGTWPGEGDMYVALRNHWPTISARLREADRKYEEMFVMHHLGANIIHHEDGTFEGYVRTTNTRVTGKTAHELRVAIEYALAAGKGTT